MSLLFQWEQKGPYRPMNPEGTKPDGDCVDLPEPQCLSRVPSRPSRARHPASFAGSPRSPL